MNKPSNIYDYSVGQHVSLQQNREEREEETLGDWFYGILTAAFLILVPIAILFIVDLLF